MIFRNWVLQNFPFLEDDFDALTDYELFCKMIEYMKKSLDKIVEYQDELNEFRAELDTYKNYFDNLDVQEEINNKLDDMAESGELTDIIAQYLGLAGVLAYDTVSNMAGAENLANGSICKTLGNTTYNDGYGAFYKIRTLINTDVIDGDNLVALTNYPTLVAEKIPVARLDNIERTLSLMNNKKYVFIGDSYLEGYTPDGTIENWGIKIANILGLTSSQYIISAYGGAGFTRTDTKTFTQMVNELTSDNDVTDVVVCGGYNDGGALYDNILSYMTTFKTAVQTKFPNAKIHVGHIGLTSDPAHVYDMAVSIKNYIKASQQLGLHYLTNVEYTLKDYFTLLTSDDVHPNTAGQNALARTISNALINGSTNVIYDFKNIGLSPANIGWTLDSNGNFGASVNNGLTTLYCESIITFALGQAVLNLSCSNQAYELADITDGYVVGTSYSSVGMPVTCVIGYIDGFATVTGKLVINNKKLYLTLYSTNAYTSANNFGSLSSAYLIQIMGSTIGMDSTMC